MLSAFNRIFTLFKFKLSVIWLINRQNKVDLNCHLGELQTKLQIDSSSYYQDLNTEICFWNRPKSVFRDKYMTEALFNAVVNN